MTDFVSGLFLSLPDHGLAMIENKIHGGGPHAYMRCLNVTGRWAIRGSAHAPLLMWSPDKRDDAEAAAGTASKARGRAVQVISYSSSSSNGLGIVEAYSPKRASSLLSAIPFTEASILKTAAQIEKLVAFARAVCQVYGDSKLSAASLIERRSAVNKELHKQFGGGSITSAVAWLTGKSGLAAYDLMVTGESNDDDLKTLEVVEAGIYLAQHLEEGRTTVGFRLG